MSRRDLADAALTDAVVDSFTTEGRFTTVMTSLVRHLHAFATEVNLTEEEWAAAIQILTATGHITDDKRQEFILWSDALGVSMLVDALAHESPNGATESTVLGPFWTPNAPKRAYADSIAEDDTALVARMARADAAALGALYDRHAPHMVAAAVRMLGSSREAEDLVHDVFLNDALDGPLPVALYSAALFRLTEGRAYSAREYRGWLAVEREAGDSRAADVAAGVAFLRRLVG